MSAPAAATQAVAASGQPAQVPAPAGQAAPAGQPPIAGQATSGTAAATPQQPEGFFARLNPFRSRPAPPPGEEPAKRWWQFWKRAPPPAPGQPGGPPLLPPLTVGPTKFTPLRSAQVAPLYTQTVGMPSRFGPFLRFHSYDASRGIFKVSILMVCLTVKTPLPPILRYFDLLLPKGQQRVGAMLVDVYSFYSFWRFDLAIQQVNRQQVMEYTILFPTDHIWTTREPYHFFVPPFKETPRWGFYCGNSFLDPNEEERLGGREPMWSDLMNVHQRQQLHFVVSGGDQLCNDAVWDLACLKPWLDESRTSKVATPWTDQMQTEVSEFYFHQYCAHFTDDPMCERLARMPHIFMWDEHEIFDGFGSYPSDIQNCPVFQGIYQIAKRFYLLFMHHASPASVVQLNGAFGERGYNFLTCIGPTQALLMLDTRSERSQEQIIATNTWTEMYSVLQSQLPRSVRHVIVLTPQPVMFPSFKIYDVALQSFTGIDQAAAQTVVARKGGLSTKIYTGLMDEVMEDMLENWATETHAEEKKYLLQMLQTVSYNMAVRITFLSGHVSMVAVGKTMTLPKQNLRQDFRHMYQVIASNIATAPAPKPMLRVLSDYTRPMMVDPYTDERMVHFFGIRSFYKAARCWVVVGEAPPTGASKDWALTFTYRMEHELFGEIRPEIHSVEIPALDLMPVYVPPKEPQQHTAEQAARIAAAANQINRVQGAQAQLLGQRIDQQQQLLQQQQQQIQQNAQQIAQQQQAAATATPAQPDQKRWWQVWKRG